VKNLICCHITDVHRGRNISLWAVTTDV